MKKTITIIDTFGFLFRSFYALPPLKSKDGFPTGLLTGFINFVFNIGKDFQTDYIVFALDAKGDTFRHEIYQEYKSHRPDVPPDLLKQLPIAISWIEQMGFQTAIKLGYEADDVIASLAKDAKQKGLSVRIVSHDKDLLQLIQEDIFLFDPIKKNIINEEKCFEKYGVYPAQFTNYQSLLGDSADNIPGVKGVGAKTAQALIEKFDNLDNIYANLEDIEKPRWVKLLNEGKDLAYISKKLVTLDNTCCVIDNIEEFNLPKENPILKIENILISFGLNKIIERVYKDGLLYKTSMPINKILANNENEKNKIEEKEKLSCEYILLNEKIKLFELINSIPKDSIIAFDTETTSIDIRAAKLVGFSFCFNKTQAYYVPIGHFYLGVLEQISIDDAKEAIKILNTHKLILQNFKYDYQIIKTNLNIDLKLYADTMIMSWLLNPSSKVGLDYMTKILFNHDMIAFKDLVKKGENFSNVDINKACEYASEDAFFTFKLYYKLLSKFKENKCEHLLKLAFNMEFKFIDVLINMQNNGIKVDITFLESLKEKNHNLIQELIIKIHKSAGGEFNINSPKQLGIILFETLKLPASKKTKSGYSTNEIVLQKLYSSHEIIPLILQYRELFKLQSTYIIPLLELGLDNKDHKIFTSFLQTGTASGRLSSKNPNLQNIPIRSEIGSKVRQAFIPQAGYKLVAIDYSQIELRLLAYFSKDEALIDAFNNNLDIHYQTALKIFGEKKAKEKRSFAKSINFGLLYGMGSRKLAQTLKISTKEAKTYIESYFKAFPSVKNYIKSIEDFTIQHGYVETLLNRRRLFDFENVNEMFKSSFLREAVNTKFQGSAADLMKLAMMKILEKFKNNININILLQIHDELLFEIKEEEAILIVKELIDIMENIYDLGISLKVSVSLGYNWKNLKKY